MNRHHWLMTACLVLMGVAMLIVLWRGNSFGFGAGTWLLLLPMGLCLGLHLFMHRHCHRNDE